MRAALCIGINDYPGTGSDLAGCVNDAQDWAQALTDREFSVSLMIDSEATRSEMVRAMTSIVTGAESGDTAVITYSGHGTWQPDDDADEPDMRDEACVRMTSPRTARYSTTICSRSSRSEHEVRGWFSSATHATPVPLPGWAHCLAERNTVEFASCRRGHS